MPQLHKYFNVVCNADRPNAKKSMKFIYENFVCEADVFSDGTNLVVRFYDKEKEHSEEQINNLVIVDPGYGYICLKFKGADCLLSGFLDETIFLTEDMVYKAIEFVENLSPKSNDAFVPYHVSRVRLTSYVEYNGEY